MLVSLAPFGLRISRLTMIVVLSWLSLRPAMAMDGGEAVVSTSNDESAPEANFPESPQAMNRTLGGRQFWGDVVFFRGWRIQQNVFSGHYRLLDPADARYVSGSLLECVKTLQEVRDARELAPMTGRAVIFIHGITRSSKSFAAMADAIRRDEDVTVVGFDYPSTRLSLEKSAEYLHQVIESLEGIEQIDLVVHSMGGLIVRTYLQRHRDSRLHRMVMLGVPNAGAEIADLLKRNPAYVVILGPAGQQMGTNEDGVLKELPVPDFEFGVVAGGKGNLVGFNPLIPGDDDGTVAVRSTRLPGAADFFRVPTLHSFLMFNTDVIAATRRFLKSGQFRDGERPRPIKADRTLPAPLEKLAEEEAGQQAGNLQRGERADEAAPGPEDAVQCPSGQTD